MNVAFWILGGLVTGLVLIGVAELLKGPRGNLTQDDKWWHLDNE